MRFFFYGTLLDGSENAVARDLHVLLLPVGPARVAGSLFAIPDPQGWYPALLTGEGSVRGAVYEASARFGPDALSRIDAYEDYDPARPESSLYVRQAVGLDQGGTAQAYVWNRSLPEGARSIGHGDFRLWLAEQGLEPFRGLREP